MRKFTLFIACCIMINTSLISAGEVDSQHNEMSLQLAKAAKAQDELLFFAEDVLKCFKGCCEEPAGFQANDRAAALKPFYRIQSSLKHAKRAISRWHAINNMRAKRLVDTLNYAIDDLNDANELFIHIAKGFQKDPQATFIQANENWIKAKSLLNDASKEFISFLSQLPQISDPIAHNESNAWIQISAEQQKNLLAFIDEIIHSQEESPSLTPLYNIHRYLKR